MSTRVQLWSCGGGRQSAGIAALIAQGRLPKPDHVCMVAVKREVRTTWPYVNAYIRPTLKALGVPFTAVRPDENELWGGSNGLIPLLPVYSNQSGSPSKLREFCSGEWKRDVATRWAASQPGWKERGVDNWVGISWDEKGRRRG